MRANPIRFATGLLMVVTGLVWILQSLDVAFAPESFMTGDTQWLIWGAVVAVTGGLLIRSAIRR